MPVEESSELIADCVHTTEEGFKNWTTKRRIGRRKVSRSIPGRAVRALEAAWHFSRAIAKPMNRFVTIRPSDIDECTPVERIEIWQRWRNRLAQFARDNGFPFTSIWTRESEPDTGRKEHLHLLMHVPRKRLAQFDELMAAWDGGTEQILNEPADYGTKVTDTGRYKNVFNYLTKNSPQAAYKRKRYFRSGGPILGKRFGTTANIGGKARAVAEVRGGLRRDLGLAPASAASTTYASHKRGISIYDGNSGKTPVFTTEMSPSKIPGNSNYPSKTEKAA
ncbi:hypothetical protein JJE66_27190 [Bradyrhizobium diazoefficiens]|uniref:hypothetical protein n=1 Tax=Bradyrhizobium diazoefficiens TaxID=1355477 RepID=UPI00190BD065|nr:hypothetical protein [Bradyrhizobium diazoefficiens]MBK3664900.1 hypothetical protein [Bradyrhizobium diazoefficiens]